MLLRLQFAVPSGVLDSQNLALSYFILRYLTLSYFVLRYLDSKLLRSLTGGHPGPDIPTLQQPYSRVKTWRALVGAFWGARCGSGRVLERTFASICSLLAFFLFFFYWLVLGSALCHCRRPGTMKNHKFHSNGRQNQISLECAYGI